MRALAAGLDLGGTKILGVATRDDGTVVASEREPTPSSSSAIVEALIDVLQRLGAATGADIATVGVGAAGLVDKAGVLHYGPNLPGSVALDLATAVGSALDLPVAIDNDVTCATLAEQRFGAAVGARDFVLIALGTGIGGGVVMDGEVRRGAHGFAGELGHMVIEPAGPRCKCGRRGCFEALASGSALGRMAREAVDAGEARAVLDLAGGEPGAVTGEHVAEAARGGDGEAVALIERLGAWLGMGAANLANILDPELVVIGGGLVQLGDLLLEPARRSFSAGVIGAEHRGVPRIVAAGTGEHAAAVGAALLGRTEGK